MLFAVSVRKVIGAYVAPLGVWDLLVFTGGIGEHSNYVRNLAASGLEFLGVTADKIQIVPTEEEPQMRATQNDTQHSLKKVSESFFT